jgi:hypothetical protein
VKTCFAALLSLALLLTQSIFASDFASASCAQCVCATATRSCCIKGAPCRTPATPTPAQRENSTWRNTDIAAPTTPRIELYESAFDIVSSSAIAPLLSINAAPIYERDCIYLI